MIRFTVTVRTDSGSFAYSAIAASSADIICDAVDLFGPCKVNVKAKQ